MDLKTRICPSCGEPYSYYADTGPGEFCERCAPYGRSGRPTPMTKGERNAKLSTMLIFKLYNWKANKHRHRQWHPACGWGGPRR